MADVPGVPYGMAFDSGSEAEMWLACYDAREAEDAARERSQAGRRLHSLR